MAARAKVQNQLMGVERNSSDGEPLLVEQVTLGPATVYALLDCCVDFFQPHAEAFPTCTESDLEEARRFDRTTSAPGAPWRLAVRAFLVSLGGRRVLVDTGGSGNGPLAAEWVSARGRLLDALAQVSVSPSDVTDVVLTHLHRDHLANTVSSDGRLVFDAADFHVQSAEIESHRLGGTSAVIETLIDPLARTGRLHTYAGRSRIAGQTGAVVTAVHTPGHTPGHQSVVVDAGDTRVVIAGDAVVHAVQVVRPEIAYSFEQDAALAAVTRERLLHELAEAGGLLATAHLGQPFIRFEQA